MIRRSRFAALVPALALALFTGGALGFSALAAADDAPPPPAAPGNDAAGRHHDNPAWAACKKQADDKKLQPGDARHEFMKNCLQSAKASPPAAS
jgi:hypothetical protein